MHMLCINTLKLLSDFFGDKVWLFLVKTGWQPHNYLGNARVRERRECISEAQVTGSKTFRRSCFGDAVSVTGRFGDGGRRCFIRKNSVFEMLQWLNYKGCLLDKHFCCHPEDRCGFSSSGSLEEFSATVTMCVKKYGLWRLFSLAWGVCEFSQKLSLDGNYCFSFRVVILIALHR